MLKIIDSVMFFNEIDLLMTRLDEHWDFVDKFYIVEATRTLSYEPKELYFKNNIKLFDRWADKIEHVVVDADEHFVFQRQRNGYEKGMANEHIQRYFVREHIKPDCDYMVMIDADEIINHKHWPEIISMMAKNTVAIMPKLQNFMYFIDHEIELDTSRMIHNMRNGTFDIFPDDIKRTKDIVGWHFSNIGGLEALKYKFRSYSHHNTVSQDAEFLAKCMFNLVDVHNYGQKFKESKIHSDLKYLPRFFKEHYFSIYHKYTYGYFVGTVNNARRATVRRPSRVATRKPEKIRQEFVFNA